MPVQKLRVGMVRFSRGRDQFSCRIDDGLNPTAVIDLSVNDDLVIVGYTNQPSIEHPVGSARQCKSVADRVRPAMLDWLYVGRLSLQPPSPIDETPTGDSAASVIGMEHCTAKCPVAEGAIKKRLNERALDFEGGVFLADNVQRFRVANTRKNILFWQSKSNNACEVRR